MGENTELNLSLTELQEVEATEDDYRDFVNIVASIVHSKYKQRRFNFIPSKDITEGFHQLEFDFTRDDGDSCFQRAIELLVDKQLDTEIYTKYFCDMLQSGDVITLGNNAKIIGFDEMELTASRIQPSATNPWGGRQHTMSDIKMVDNRYKDYNLSLFSINISFYERDEYEKWLEELDMTEEEHDGGMEMVDLTEDLEK